MVQLFDYTYMYCYGLTLNKFTYSDKIDQFRQNWFIWTDWIVIHRNHSFGFSFAETNWVSVNQNPSRTPYFSLFWKLRNLFYNFEYNFTEKTSKSLNEKKSTKLILFLLYLRMDFLKMNESQLKSWESRTHKLAGLDAHTVTKNNPRLHSFDQLIIREKRILQKANPRNDKFLGKKKCRFEWFYSKQIEWYTFQQDAKRP